MYLRYALIKMIFSKKDDKKIDLKLEKHILSPKSRLFFKILIENE
jgi:hypothetical protein